MIDLAHALHYGTIAFIIVLPAFGVSLGEGIIGKAALTALDIQPNAHQDIVRTATFGSALIETSVIISLVMGFFFLGSTNPISLTNSIAECGIACAIGLPGFFIGIFSALPAKEGCLSIARQPFFQQKIVRLMLITQSIVQTPIIFSFVVALFIKNQTAYVLTVLDSIRLASSGLCIGLGSIGPAIGLGLFGQAVCKGIGINRTAYEALLSFTFICEAVIETPIIFTLIIALLIISHSGPYGDTFVEACRMIGAALCMGIGILVPGIITGKTSAAACQQIAYTPENYIPISRSAMFAMGMIDTSVIYALIIAGLLLFVS